MTRKKSKPYRVQPSARDPAVSPSSAPANPRTEKVGIRGYGDGGQSEAAPSEAASSAVCPSTRLEGLDTIPPGEVVLVSACLLGVYCRYDGSSNPAPELRDLARRARLVPICPEQLGGLPTPRPPAQCESGDGRAVLEGKARIRNVHGQDVTAQYRHGAEEALRLAQLYGARHAILKERSPSCACHFLYCDGKLIAGRGVTAALLEQHGYQLHSLDPPKQLREADADGRDE
jgi:uncharacterized protein YbbK (DUF523 family)